MYLSEYFTLLNFNIANLTRFPTFRRNRSSMISYRDNAHQIYDFMKMKEEFVRRSQYANERKITWFRIVNSDQDRQ